MAKERMVTRTIIESKKYKVYKMEGLQLTLLETVDTKGKLSEKDLAKKHNVDKVVIECIAEKKVTYGMPVDEFMQYAKIVESEENQDTNQNDKKDEVK